MDHPSSKASHNLNIRNFHTFIYAKLYNHFLHARTDTKTLRSQNNFFYVIVSPINRAEANY